jgi:hypothetical protein
MLYVVLALVALVVLFVVVSVVMLRRWHQEKRKTDRDVIDSHANPAFNADEAVTYRNQHVTTTTRGSAQPPQPRPVTVFDRSTTGSSSTAGAGYYDDYDASQPAAPPRQAVYSSTAPGQASGRNRAEPPTADDYEVPVPVYADANDHPHGHQGRNGAAAVSLDRDLYVSNGSTSARDHADPYELPTLSSA